MAGFDELSKFATASIGDMPIAMRNRYDLPNTKTPRTPPHVTPRDGNVTAT